VIRPIRDSPRSISFRGMNRPTCKFRLCAAFVLRGRRVHQFFVDRLVSLENLNGLLGFFSHWLQQSWRCRIIVSTHDLLRYFLQQSFHPLDICFCTLPKIRKRTCLAVTPRSDGRTNTRFELAALLHPRDGRPFYSVQRSPRN
jgi:hypothetical protein